MINKTSDHLKIIIILFFFSLAFPFFPFILFAFISILVITGSTIGQGEFNRIAFPNPDTFLQNKYHVSDSYWPSPHSRKPHCTPYPYTTEKTNNSSISVLLIKNKIS